MFLTSAGVTVDTIIRSRVETAVEKSPKDELRIEVDALVSPYGR